MRRGVSFGIAGRSDRVLSSSSHVQYDRRGASLDSAFVKNITQSEIKHTE